MPVQVLGDVGDQAVLADHDDDVLGREEERCEVGALDAATPPVERDRSGDSGQGGLHCAVPILDLGQVASSGCEEECDLAARAVPGEQLVEFGAAVHHDDPGREGHDVTVPRPSRASTGVSRSGVSTRLSMSGRLPASSFSASA